MEERFLSRVLFICKRDEAGARGTWYVYPTEQNHFLKVQKVLHVTKAKSILPSSLVNFETFLKGKEFEQTAL